MEKILESGAFMTMEHFLNRSAYTTSESCIYPVACLIIVMDVDNNLNGVRHNCEELLAQFEADVAADGRIDLHREGDMSSRRARAFLSDSVPRRYLNNPEPETGEITADQEAYIDTLLAQYEMTVTNCNPKGADQNLGGEFR